jgi:hypothetical protein
MPSLVSSLDQIIASGGDTRLDVDPKTGRNRYECIPRPGDAIPFGSCTSSSVSPRGFAAAQHAQRAIASSRDSCAAANSWATDIRRQLRRLLILPNDVDIALAPSGTDVELLALALAAGREQRPIVNIVVGPSEIGSGSPLAAACRHYDRQTPSGQQVTVGEPVAPALASQVAVRTVDLRTCAGEMLPESDIDAAVIELFVEAIEADAIVLLHIVAHSKTGVHAPSLSCVARLREISDDLAVVVDAAQGRFSRRGLRDALQKDYLVMFTGSKFYGGPPFSGALLVPPRFQPRSRQLSALPAGFGAYFSAIEMPESWREIRRSLSAEPNIGAILRWAAAIAEIEAYYNVPSDARLRVLRFFEAEVPKILGASQAIRMLPVFPPVYDDISERLLESKTTVFGFWVTPLGAGKPLDKASLKQMHADLTIDLSASDEKVDRPILAQKYHLGQPVDLDPGGCILRIALGGVLITQVATDVSIGETLNQRLQWLRNQLIGLRQKIEYLASRNSSSRPAVLSFGEVNGNASTENWPSTSFVPLM